MGSNAIKIAAIALVILALILVFVAYRYGQSLQVHARQQQAAQQANPNVKPTIMAVVATKPLPAQVKISRNDVALVPVQVAPQGYLKSVDDAINRIPLQDVDKGTPLTMRLFTENNPLAHSIPAGTEALSLRVDDVVGAGGFVRPGDHVDVLLYLRQQTAGANGQYKVQTQARVLLRNALVLAYQDLVVPPPADMKNQKNGGARVTHAHTAVLAIPDADTTRVMLGASLGELRLALLRQVTPPASATVTAPASATSVVAASAASVPNPAAAHAAAGTAAALNAMQASTAAAGPSKPASAASIIANNKVITLQELGFIRKKQEKEAQKARGYTPPRHHRPPPVAVYRGDKVQMVRP
ncbi:MAG TPA: Flp pilus assembly protein CpaB [Nevskiaceae bacterium]|nr:Flp pilus assembly protein CpaB [Nevskiaceae bacterium]